jgi:CTP:molybdopterin cytidylyltransferase MocA
MKTAGIVLAAGASQRMGQPKALLRGPDGTPLAVRQAQVLRAGGCGPVAVVLGADINAIRRELPEDLAVVENPRWALGRATSLQAAIRAHPEAEAFLFLPVDAVGIRPETIRAMRAAAAGDPERIWRPVFQGGKGNLLWIPQAAGRELLSLPPEARVDEWARPLACEWATEDPAILRNINHPEEWAEVLRRLAAAGGSRG